MTTAVNFWLDNKCAKAFWSQHELPPYRELLAHTSAWLDPQPGERWLDLGCGCGQLSRALWQRSAGRTQEIVGMDFATINATAYAKLRAELQPQPGEQALRFVGGNFRVDLASWPSARFDGVVSGLAIHYADSFSEENNCWTSVGYDHVLHEIHRLLTVGGRFVFSVNVPEPSWGRVAWSALGGTWRAANPLRYLKKAYRMWRYGGWLKREARRGRFLYLPLPIVLDKLTEAGFVNIEYRLSYARQAYLFRCKKASTTPA